MGRTPSSTNKKTSELRSKNGNKPKSLTEGINEQVNAAEEKVQEIEERGKPKRLTIAELTKRLKATEELLEDYKKRHQGIEKAYTELRASYKETLARSGSLKEKNDSLIDENTKLKKDNDDIVANSQEVLAENKRLHDSNNQLGIGNEQLVNRNKQLNQENQELLDRKNGKIFNEEPQAANSEEFGKTETSTSEPKATSSENAEEIKSANSENFEETVTPETGEAKVEGEPKANTEQTQTTQEPKSEAKQTSTESSEMTPEEAYEYLSDKKNFKEASTYFSSGKDSYIGTNGKHLPKSWFDVYNGNKNSDHSMQHILFNKNNKDVFTASLRDKGLLEDPKKEPSREDTVRELAEAGAKAEFDKWVNSKGNKFRGIVGKHPWISGGLLLSVGVPAIMKAINAFADYGREQAIEDMQVPDKEFWGESEDNNDDYNGEPIEPGNVAEQVANAAQETGQADNTAEEQAAQALQENLPQGEADTTNQSKGESPVATNASTPASTKANNAPASTAKPAPTQDITQGLPPVVVNNTPPVNPNSSGMTYSQMIEAGQAPQAGSMAYNANNPDMVTAGLIDAMNQNSQAGSDAIGYGDLYDQNFIDFWAKRNPNLAYAVSQGRKS